MLKENTVQTLEDTLKKIDGLKEFHIPVTLKIIEDYEKAEVETYFIEQQKLQLQKLYKMLGELEAKAGRLQKSLCEYKKGSL